MRIAGIIVLVFIVTAFAAPPAGCVERIAVFHGENTNDQFAISICSAGDVNGDGYQDLLVGANLEDSGGDASGRCYLYFGGMTPDTIPDLTFTGVAGERFGTVVAGGGDLNGDGFSDIAVYASGATADPGKVYVFFGSYSMDSFPDVVLTGTTPGGRFGRGLSLRGDLNGDGFDDLVVGSPEADSTGTVYLYYGAGQFDSEADMVLRGEYAGDYFGFMVSSGGDADGDGSDDLLVGAPRNDDVEVWAGKAYLYLCGTSMDTIPDAEMTGEAIGDGFGSSGEIIGDISGDSIGETIVSAPYYNSIYGGDTGRLYLFLGGTIPDGSPDDILEGELASGQFGYAVSSADVDGDGCDDLVVGAPGYGGSAVQQGKVYLYHGQYPLSPVPAYTDESQGEYDGLGISIAGLEKFTLHEGSGGGFAAGGWNIGGKGAANLYGEPVAVTGDNVVPRPGAIFLSQNFPNPFNPVTNIGFGIKESGHISIRIYDAAGRLVTTLVDESRSAGRYTTEWNGQSTDGSPAASGAYFYRLTTKEFEETKKMILLR